VGGRIPWWDATLATVSGIFVNNITPTGRLGGEACRILVTRLHGEIALSRAALALLCDRLGDAIAVSGLVVLALPLVGPLVASRLRLGVIVLAVLVAAVLVFGRWLRRALRATLTGWQRDLRTASLGAGQVAAALGYSFVIWTEDLLRVLAAAAAFDVWLTVPQASAVAVVAILGAFAPTIGGLGAVEGGMVGGLVLFGVPLETAIAITTVERVVSYGVGTVTGGVAVISMGGTTLLRAALGRPKDAATSRGAS
jgi:uncharacterized membrane protein YbhN (UPF0104 family)